MVRNSGTTQLRRALYLSQSMVRFYGIKLPRSGKQSKRSRVHSGFLDLLPIGRSRRIKRSGASISQLPLDHHPPPDLPEFSLHDPVSFHIPLEFPAPVVEPRLRYVAEAAALVPVPETAVNENDHPVARQNNIGAARQVPNVKAKSVAKAVKERPNRQLRLGVASADADINAERLSLVRVSATLHVAKQEAQLLRPFSDPGALNCRLRTGCAPRAASLPRLNARLRSHPSRKPCSFDHLASENQSSAAMLTTAWTMLPLPHSASWRDRISTGVARKL